MADRAVPGHWEGDRVISRTARRRWATLVERGFRFVPLIGLPDGRISFHVTAQLRASVRADLSSNGIR